MNNENVERIMEKRVKYLYVVRLDANLEKDKQFNEWYNNEHIPALLKVPGVISANRFTSLEGTPKYIAIYELENPNIRTSEAWKKAVEMTPRPKDVTIQNATRNLYERIYP